MKSPSRHYTTGSGYGSFNQVFPRPKMGTPTSQLSTYLNQYRSIPLNECNFFSTLVIGLHPGSDHQRTVGTRGSTYLCTDAGVVCLCLFVSSRSWCDFTIHHVPPRTEVKIMESLLSRFYCTGRDQFVGDLPPAMVHQIWHAGSTLEVYRQGWSPEDNCGMEPCGESLGNISATTTCPGMCMVQYFHLNFRCFKTICQTLPWRNHNLGINTCISVFLPCSILSTCCPKVRTFFGSFVF